MIKLHTAADGQFYFTFCNSKGQVRLTSETYKTRQNRAKQVKLLNSQLIKPVKVVEVWTVNKKTLKNVEFARQLDKRS